MADDWQIGDLALCIKDGKVTRAGACYTVSDVCAPEEKREFGRNHSGMPLLRFGEFVYSRHSFEWSEACRFVKVTPPATDEFDRETIRLLNGEQVPA